MPRRRMVDARIAQSEQVLSLSFAARWLYLLAILSADDAGRLKRHALWVQWRATYAVSRGRGPQHWFNEYLEQMHVAGLLHQYDAGTEKLLHHPNWLRFQKLSPPLYSAIAPCPLCPVDPRVIAGTNAGLRPDLDRTKTGLTPSTPMFPQRVTRPRTPHNLREVQHEVLGSAEVPTKAVPERGSAAPASGEGSNGKDLGHAAVVYMRLLRCGAVVSSDDAGGITIEHQGTAPPDLIAEAMEIGSSLLAMKS